MDQCNDDSCSEGNSFTSEIERGDAVIVYSCKDRTIPPSVNHVTKVLIDPPDHNQCGSGMTVFKNDSSSEALGSAHQESSPFGPFGDYGLKTQVVSKEYQELADTLCHLTECEQRKGKTSQDSIADSADVSRKFRLPHGSEVNSMCKNPFLADTNAYNSGHSTDGSAGGTSDASNSAIASTGGVPERAQVQSSVTTSEGLSSGSGTDPPRASQAPDLLGRDSTVAASGHCPSGSPVASQETHTGDHTVSHCSVSFQAIPPETATQYRNSNSSSSEPAQPVPLNPKRPSQNLLPASEATKAHISNAACSKALPPIQESPNTPGPSESSFHFPEPPRSPPLVCVPVKEVKFEEPPKHRVVTALENVVEALSEVVPITVQPCRTTSPAVLKDERYEVELPTYPTSQIQTKDDSNVPQTASVSSNSEPKMHALKHGEVGIISDQADNEEHEPSYGIIGNEDNLSEITLPPLADSANQRDHDVGRYTNGEPRHRITISIDQQPANSSKQKTAITGVVVIVLLVSTIILLAGYKLFQRNTPN